jgi:hypothetical protein
MLQKFDARHIGKNKSNICVRTIGILRENGNGNVKEKIKLMHYDAQSS